MIQPVTPDFIASVSKNPSVWWHCLGCMSCKSNDVGMSHPASEPSNTNPVNAEVIMQSMLMSFKKDMLTFVGETMDKKFQTFRSLLGVDASGKRNNRDSVSSSLPINRERECP